MIINYNAGKMDLDGTAPQLSVTFHAPQYELVFNVQKIAISGKMQQKEVTPTQSTQEVVPDGQFTGLSKVVVNPIPHNYGHITFNGGVITVS